MSTGLISIFTLPHEIDALHLILYNLRRNGVYLSPESKMGLDITLCLSDYMTDWDKSLLPKEYFSDKFSQIIDTLCVWSDWINIENVNIEYGTDILGCVSQRRHSLKYLDKYDFTMWLDTDLFFGDKLLAYMASSVDALLASGIDHYIITPQVTRQWDASWDPIVNEHLIHHEINHTDTTADIFELGLSDFGEIELEPLNTFKAAGGWATVISNKLLKITGIPDSFGHYGMEDTYVLNCSSHLSLHSKTIRPKQFVLKNFVMGENRKQHATEYLKKCVASIDRKNEFRIIANQNFSNELKKFCDQNL